MMIKLGAAVRRHRRMDDGEETAPLLDGWRGWPLPRVMLAAAAAGGVIFAPFTMLANAREDRDWLVLITWPFRWRSFWRR